ncbi:hypothetical protein ACFW4O_36705 [Streptomyces mutabilis]|uniref:hypothetical protein n=1 Tax=Streptomyces mutabilis TaxID=67332 RepID=UPI0036832073
MPTLAEVRAFISELPDVVSVAALQEAATNRLIQLDAAKRPVITPAAPPGSARRSPRRACAC